MRVAVEIVLSDGEVTELSKLSKSRSTSVRLAERSRIVLLAGMGMTNEAIGEALGISRQKAGRWRQRCQPNRQSGFGSGSYRPKRLSGNICTPMRTVDIFRQEGLNGSEE